jgi:predicted ArsR family transcriptional regulator
MRPLTAQQYVDAVGDGSTTEQVAEKLGVTVKKTRHNLRNLANLGLIKQYTRDHWRPV